MSPRPITEDDLNGHIDGVLDSTREEEVLAYLSAHPEEAARVSAYQRERALLRDITASAWREPVPPRLDLARLVQAHHWDWPRHGRSAVAAAILLLCGLVLGWSVRGWHADARETLVALGQDAAASYSAFASDPTHPVEIRADAQPDLAAWIAQRLGRPVPIPDLTASGYHFMGGRVVPTLQGPAALFMYEGRPDKRLVILARPLSQRADLPMAAFDHGGLNGVQWSDAGLGYSLIGPMAPDAAWSLAALAQRQIHPPT